MGGVDVVVFTAGIGENAWKVRKGACEGLEFLGIKIDPEKNNSSNEETIISEDDSRVKVMVIPTNEEWMIAKDTMEIIEKL
jgi:acetate kinase